MNKKKISFIMLLAGFLTFSVSANDDLAKKISGTRESICYNHPNKELCVAGINAMLKTAVAASEVASSCKSVEKAGGEKRDECSQAESALRWIKGN